MYDAEQVHHGCSGRHDLRGLRLAAQREVRSPTYEGTTTHRCRGDLLFMEEISPLEIQYPTKTDRFLQEDRPVFALYGGVL